MTFEAYKVAVRINLLTNAAEMLGMMASRLKSVGNDADHTARKLGLIGAGMTVTGIAGLSILGKTVDAAKDYAHQLSLVNTLGLKHAEVTSIINKSWETSRQVVTTTATENLEAIRELRSAFGAGQEEHALGILDTVQRAKAILTSLTGKEQIHVGFDMVKAIELRTAGGMTEAAMQRNAELMTRTLIGMGGTLTVNDFHQALKYAKMPVMKWSDEFTYEYLPTFMQEMKAGKGGASSAGVALRTFDKAVHGRMQKSAVPLWIESGLISSSDIVKNATGHWQMKPGAVKGIGLEESNPYLWVQQYLAPAIKKLTTMKHISEETAINAMFSDPNSAFTAYTFYKKAQQFERDKKLISQANSMEAYDKLLKSDPVLAEQALHKQWQNMLSILGYQIMPDLLKGLGWLVEQIRDLTTWFKKNEGLTRNLVIAFGGLSAVMAVGGPVITGIALTRFALGGLGGAVGGLGGAASTAATAIGAGGAGTLVGGLLALGAAVGGMMWVLDKIGTGDRDEKNHPGKKFIRHGRGAGNGEWVVDPTQSQEHAGQHWKSLGRAGGYWENDTGGGYVAPKSNKPIQITVVNKLDRKGLTTAITEEQDRNSERGMKRSGALSDPRMTPAMPGLVGAH